MDRKHQKFFKRTLVPVFSLACARGGSCPLSFLIGTFVATYGDCKPRVVAEIDAYSFVEPPTRGRFFHGLIRKLQLLMNLNRNRSWHSYKTSTPQVF